MWLRRVYEYVSFYVSVRQELPLRQLTANFVGAMVEVGEIFRSRFGLSPVLAVYRSGNSDSFGAPLNEPRHGLDHI